MGSAYTPGLTVSGDTVVQKVRRLPIKGDVTVEVGESVDPDQVIARAMLPGPQQAIKLAEALGVEAGEARGFFLFKEGEKIEKDELIAETKGLWGMFKQEVHSQFEGTVEAISDITGHILIREPSVPVEIESYIKGKVVNVLAEEGATIEARCAMIQGIFGVGGERNGTIRVAVSDPDDRLEESHILDSDAGNILIGGSGITAGALKRASDIGVIGLIVGAVRDVDLTEFLGYDIGVAITGQENINLTLIATEGFGQLRMAGRTFDLLKSLEGMNASLNGATQIRAGVIRPELIVPLAADAAEGHGAGNTGALMIGTPIRMIREPYFGKLAEVSELPPQLETVDSGAKVRVLRAKIEGGEEVTVPRANVEIIVS